MAPLMFRAMTLKFLKSITIAEPRRTPHYSSLVRNCTRRSPFPQTVPMEPFSHVGLPNYPSFSLFSVYHTTMPLKALHFSSSHAPSLDFVPSLCHCSTHSSTGNAYKCSCRFCKMPKFVVIGHRGHGMNILESSSDPRMRAIKENSIMSFNVAATFPIDFIEFDVQVTKDDCPVIFHDDFILSEENGNVFEKRIRTLTLNEFLSYGPQRETGNKGKVLLRKTEEGKIVKWDVDQDDSLCTLQDAFVNVEPSLGFNIELKFDDHFVYQQHHLLHVLQPVLKIVFDYAKDRPIIFSTFQPDAAILIRQLQSTYPVLFLTTGECELYYDIRRNSLEEALKLCLENDLQGIVSETRGVFRNHRAATKIKESKLSLLTYGELNNVPEYVYLQHYVIGIDGVIVDLVEEITDAVAADMKHKANL